MGEAIGLRRLGEALAAGVEAGLHLGAIARVQRAGVTLGQAVVGEARPGEAMRPDHLLSWMSTGKPVTAMAIALLIDWGELALDTRVERVIPEFTGGGKEAITVEHLLTHTAGLTGTPYRVPRDDWDAVIDAICRMSVAAGWSVGHDAGYSPRTGWFVLGEVVRRVSGASLPGFLKAEVLDPTGATSAWVGVPADRYDEVAGRLCPTYDTTGREPRPTGSMDRDAVTACDPGGGAIGTIGDMTAFYGALLDIVRGRREGPWSRQIVERFVGRRRTDTPDATFRHTMDWGLGVMVNSSRHGEATVPYGFGPLASDEAFGHGGYQSSVAFADPSSDLVVAVVCNGHPGEAKHDRRMRRALKAMAEDLRAADGAGLPGQTATSE